MVNKAAVHLNRGAGFFGRAQSFIGSFVENNQENAGDGQGCRQIIDTASLDGQEPGEGQRADDAAEIVHGIRHACSCAVFAARFF